MTTQEQDKRWNDLSEEKQKSAREMYKQITKPLNPDKSNAQNEADIMSFALETTYGTHNLNPKPKIRTWKDVEKECGDVIEVYRTDDDFYSLAFSAICFNNKLGNKLIATLKIAKLIELGFGGMVTEEEWLNEENPKSVIKCTTDIKPRLYNDTVYDDIQFVAFHTDKQREEFMSYPENRELVKQYYLMTNE